MKSVKNDSIYVQNIQWKFAPLKLFLLMSLTSHDHRLQQQGEQKRLKKLRHGSTTLAV
jgi:hypothetical protein